MTASKSFTACCNRRFVVKPITSVAARSSRISQRLMGASLLVFKNKSDVPGCLSEEEVCQVRQLSHPRSRWICTYIIGQGLSLDSILTHKWHVLPCSAMTGQNLFEGLEWVVKDAKDRLFLY